MEAFVWGKNMEWDVFISHAWEDKESFVRPLAKALEAKGLRVWFDELTLTVGDSLRRSIDRGLANSRYGIVILSENFFKKEWPQKELDGLAVREVSGEKVILPVWHNITADQVRRYSPILADRIAVSSSRGLEHVVAELLRAMRPHLEKVGDKGREEAERKAREETERLAQERQEREAREKATKEEAERKARQETEAREAKQQERAEPTVPIPIAAFDWLEKRFGFGRGCSYTGIGCGFLLLIILLFLLCNIITGTNWFRPYILP